MKYSDLIKKQEQENKDFLNEWHIEKADLMKMGRNLDAQAIDEHYAEKHRKMVDLHTHEREQFFEQGKPDKEKFIHPVTGQEMSPEAYQKLQEFIERQNQRAQEKERKSKDRGHDR